MIPNLSKEMIDLLQQLRKRLRSEFGVDLKLSQDDIVPRILELVENSKDQKTLLLFADLEDMMGVSLREKTSEPEAPAKATSDSAPKRIYRGQVVADPTPQVAQSQVTKRIYRGQVVA